MLIQKNITYNEKIRFIICRIVRNLLFLPRLHKNSPVPESRNGVG